MGERNEATITVLKIILEQTQVVAVVTELIRLMYQGKQQTKHKQSKRKQMSE